MYYIFYICYMNNTKHEIMNSQYHKVEMLEIV